MHKNTTMALATVAGGLLLTAGGAAADLPNGVAAGDVDQTSAVLWTRSDAPGDVDFEVATDAGFLDVVATGTASVVETLVPVKLEVSGLLPGTDYFYRATDDHGATASGTFRTPATPGVAAGLRFGATGDWQQAPPYPSLQNIPQRDLELFLKLGDTIFADLETPAIPGVVQARTLEQFRIKHEEVASPRPEAPGFNVMPDVAASAFMLVTIDDHELVDNFAGGAAPGESPDAGDINPGEPPLFTDPVDFVNQTQAYIAALQAYTEYHPIRPTTWDAPGDDRVDGRPKLFRSSRFGDDAGVIMLDSRSFRDVQLPPVDLADPLPFIVATFTPGRTLLGQPQLAAAKAELLAMQNEGVLWKFVTIPEPIQNFGPVNAEDRFEGYAAERTELLKFIDDNNIQNVVFMAGDFHGFLVNNLTYQLGPGLPQIATGAFEIVMGPAAFFDGRFGPNVVNISAAAGLITPQELAFYNALPVGPDLDDVLDDKDDFVEELLREQTSLFGYDPIGLDDNLPVAEGRIDAELLQGAYVASHGFGWTEFEIDADTGVLTVTAWNIEAYGESDFLADPQEVISRQPEIVAVFTVEPTFPCDGDLNGDGTVDVADLNAVLVAFGTSDAGDLDGDGVTDIRDLNILLGTYGDICD